jgi:hypothetical protein
MLWAVWLKQKHKFQWEPNYSEEILYLAICYSKGWCVSFNIVAIQKQIIKIISLKTSPVMGSAHCIRKLILCFGNKTAGIISVDPIL